MKDREKIQQIMIAVLGVVALALLVGNVYLFTRPDQPDYQVLIGVPKGSAVDFTAAQPLDQAQTQTVIFGLIGAQRVDPAETPQDLPDGVMQIAVPKEGAIYYKLDVWLEEDGVWLRTGDQSFHYIANGYYGDEITQIVQQQLELGSQPTEE